MNNENDPLHPLWQALHRSMDDERPALAGLLRPRVRRQAPRARLGWMLPLAGALVLGIALQLHRPDARPNPELPRFALTLDWAAPTDGFGLNLARDDTAWSAAERNWINDTLAEGVVQ